MSIILTLDKLRDMIKEDILKVTKRHQKEGGVNYYFTPNIAIKLYKAKVVFKNPKFLVFQFSKDHNINLLHFLRGINTILLQRLKNTHSEMFNKEIYSFFSETETHFTIRSYLPNRKNKYHIQCESSDNSVSYFTLPKLEYIFDNITLEFRNVWCLTNNDGSSKSGFNLELKNVYYDYN
jgi:hypothetical protein